MLEQKKTLFQAHYRVFRSRLRFSMDFITCFSFKLIKLIKTSNKTDAKTILIEFIETNPISSTVEGIPQSCAILYRHRYLFLFLFDLRSPEFV